MRIAFLVQIGEAPESGATSVDLQPERPYEDRQEGIVCNENSLGD